MNLTEEREALALRFIEQHNGATYRQIADHLTEKTGVPHNRNMVAGLIDRATRREQRKRGRG